MRTLSGLVLLLGVGCAAPVGSERTGEARAAISVGAAVDAGCSSSLVAGLSAQLVAQLRCDYPGAIGELGALPDVMVASSVLPYLEVPALAALEQAIGDNPGVAMQINGMLRTLPQQYLFYRWYLDGACGIAFAVEPGDSNHETGFGVDVQPYDAWQPILEAHGFGWAGPGEPAHFDYLGADAVDYREATVRAFQELWNVNNPGDTLAEDGVYGPQTELRLSSVSADGFAIGPDCGEPPPPGGLSLVASFVGLSDAHADGPSKGVVDALEGDLVGVEVQLANGPSPLADASLSLDLPAALEGVGYVVSSNGSTLDEGDLTGSSLSLGDIAGDQQLTIELSLSAASYSVDRLDPAALALSLDGTSAAAELTIDVYSPWRWELDGERREGWSSSAELHFHDGALVATGPGVLALDGPAPEWLASDVSDLATIRLAIAREGIATGPAYLEYTTSDAPDPDPSQRFALDVPSDSQLHDVVLDTTSAPGFSGALTSLRLVYFDDDAGLPRRGVLAYLRLGDTAPPPPITGSNGCACHLGRAPETGAWWSLFALLPLFRRRSRSSA